MRKDIKSRNVMEYRIRLQEKNRDLPVNGLKSPFETGLKVKQ